MKKLRVAVIGQGRSGRNIHGAYFKSERNTNYEVAYVVELDEFRRNRALNEYPGCKVFTDYHELFNCKDIDLVVNASYSETHYCITKDLLKHGFNVLCEKPFGQNFYECSDMIKAAKDNGVVLAVFQQTFFAPYVMETKKLVESGKLGDLLQVSIHFNGFSRRWDWQTLQDRMGGGIYNTGPHPIGLAVDFLDYSPDMRVGYSKLGSALTSGDTDDFAKIILTAPGKPVVDVEVHSNDAFNDYTLKLLGTKGCYQCTTQKYKMKYIVDGENVEKPVQRDFIHNDNGDPIYCSEQLNAHVEEGEFEGEVFGVGSSRLYANLYDAIVNGAELYTKPEHAAMIINVIERVHAENPMPKRFF